MMEKVVELGSWSGAGMEHPIAMIKLAQRGLVGLDRSDLLIKRAASHIFADMLDGFRLQPGDIPIHTIAIGATEAYGPNRNGDGFKEATCRSQYKTFISKPLRDYSKSAEHNGARFFRHHKNKDPAISYGYVKAAVYNPRMRRIELLLIGNGTKEAAERNGGFVMPDSTIAKLESGDDLAGSMACKVAYDVCANCFNKAPSRADYCAADTCINPFDGFRGLGCKDGLTKLASNGRQAYVENPGAIFFDWSEVVRPAERTAYGGTADYLMKAAADNSGIGGAALAEWYAGQNGYTLQLDGSDSVLRQREVLRKLAEIDRRLDGSNLQRDRITAVAFRNQAPMDLAPIGSPGSTKAASAFQALAGEKIVLSLPDFLRLVRPDADETKIASYVADIAPHLPGIYRAMNADSNIDQQLITWAGIVATEGLPPAYQRNWAQKQALSHSLSPAIVRERVMRSTLRQVQTPEKLASAVMVKQASETGPAHLLARHYAAIKLAMLASFPTDSEESELTQTAAVLQNYAYQL